jgi:hypothetical protein
MGACLSARARVCVVPEFRLTSEEDFMKPTGIGIECDSPPVGREEVVVYTVILGKDVPRPVTHKQDQDKDELHTDGSHPIAGAEWIRRAG